MEGDKMKPTSDRFRWFHIQLSEARYMKKAVIAVLIMTALVTGIAIFSDKTVRADSESALSKKIDEVLNNQKAILSGIDALKQELTIVKIRVTQQQ
jgi:hypothetical protein